MYDIVDFAIKVYYDTKLIDEPSHNSTISLHVNGTIHRTNGSYIHELHHSRGALYDDSAFAVIVIGVIDLFISSSLLYVAALQKYELRAVVFVAAIWGFVMAFLNTISFGICIALSMVVEMIVFLAIALMEGFFGYVILSYFKFMTVVVERGLDDVHMSYFPEDHSNTDFSEVQMDEAVDERPIMDDQDDMQYDDRRIILT